MSYPVDARCDAEMKVVERPFSDVKAAIQKAPSDEDGSMLSVATSLLTSADEDYAQIS